MSAVAELEAGLNAMLNLKPPGVSGSQIKSITALCVDNVQSESVLIQKLFTHFKKTPGTHKLGVLYVVDSVTRRWIDNAKQHGQIVNSSAHDGTYAAGVHRVTELLPVLMNDILQSAPEEQKEKIKKLVDIWEKGQTFPANMIESFKQKLNAPKNESTTPVGSPPPGPGLPGLSGFNVAANNKPAASGTPNDIMEVLKKIAQQNVTAAPSNHAVPVPASAPPPSNPYSVPLPPNTSVQQPPLPVTQSQPTYPFSAPPPVNPAMPYGYPSQAPVQGQAAPFAMPASSQPPIGFPGAGAIPGAAPGMDPAVAQQFQLIQLLAQQGIPAEQIPTIIATLQNGVGAGANPAAPLPQAGQNPYSNAWAQDGSRPGESRDQRDYNSRSPNRYHERSRSRSPPRHWESRENRDSPRGRSDRAGYGSYGRDSPGRGRDDRAGWNSEYRQRSPPGRQRVSQSPPGYDQMQPGEKWVEYDKTLPAGQIKVLSRTLFVGGVTCSEAELRSIFSEHGQVQTCIVNKDKRHAFVKMFTRHDAAHAKKAMEKSQYRTRWGVGFGPRDCSDYATGVSVIPISKLTEADRKWMLTADWGGSGGRPIEGGLVVEEPDIEIGAGVSSKAISRRMQTDRGGKHGPKSTKAGEEEEQNLARWRRNKDGRKEERRDDRGSVNIQQPVVAEFPYGIPTGPNGMPLFPPGFAFPPPS
ncbi:hypothetical protein BX600DRAFT_127408 [Xylariales sp. PMI_506]|nr:hypothetical protein BX600DRAFT_127408 [Xylariales sp. PMI_506]